MRKRRICEREPERQFKPSDAAPYEGREQEVWDALQTRVILLEVIRQAQDDVQADTWTPSRDARYGRERAASRRAMVREAWAWLNDREDTGLGSCAWICSIFHESQAAAIAVAWYGRQLALAISDTVPDGYVDIITRPA